MSIVVRMRKQKAVWWKRQTPDRYGQFSFDLPVEIKCRWDDNQQNMRKDLEEKEESTATVYVDRLMVVGDRLKYGPIDSNTPDDPIGDPDTHEIHRFEVNPSLRNKPKKTLYTAHL